MPKEIELTPTLQLLWMTSELAEANHVGKILKDGFLNDFVPLCDELVEEEPALVAWADLNLSVAYTNGFDFEGAQNVLERWENTIPGHPGRQYYGQILSTQGQLSAFLGKQKEAVAFFDKALDYLVKNSDPDKGELDRMQTMAYNTIAIMDDTEVSQKELDKALEAYLGLDPMRAAIYRVGSMDEPYAHHILL